MLRLEEDALLGFARFVGLKRARLAIYGQFQKSVAIPFVRDFMIDNKLNFFFKHQIWHIGGLIVLYYVALQMVDFETDSNVFLGISSKNWFLFSMLTPLLHQGYVFIT